jgi:hypothetical protein
MQPGRAHADLLPERLVELFRTERPASENNSAERRPQQAARDHRRVVFRVIREQVF